MEPIDPQHVLALTAIVQQMINESGDPVGFDAHAWTSRWIQRPLPALGGALPAEYMVTPEGRELVERLVWSMQSGAYQ
jgi:uncharacterized protein (DUF2384 family)